MGSNDTYNSSGKSEGVVATSLDSNTLYWLEVTLVP